MDFAQLIEQLKSGDEAAGPILVSTVAPRLLGYAQQIAGDLPQADREASVEYAIETAIRRIDRYDPHRGTFPGWARTFVRHAVSDWRRRHPDGPPLALDDVDELIAPEGDDGAERPANPLTLALNELVLTLSEADQLLVRLRFTEGLTHGEIASRLNITESACRKRLERTIGRLRASADADLTVNAILKGENG